MLLWCTPGLAGSGAGQQTTIRGEEIPTADYVARARGLVRLLYPNLDPGLHVIIEDAKRWDMSGATSAFDLRLVRNSVSTVKAKDHACDFQAQVFRGRFLFDPSQERELIQFVSFDLGPQGAEVKYQVLMRGNPGWSDEEAVHALKESGGKYGPQDGGDLIRSLPVAAMEPYIGKLKINEAQFILGKSKQDDSSGGDLGTRCSWRVTGVSELRSGAKRVYVILINAFDGRIWSIGQFGPPTSE